MSNIGFIRGNNAVDQQRVERVGRTNKTATAAVDGRTIRAKDVMRPKIRRDSINSLSYRLKLDG